MIICISRRSIGLSSVLVLKDLRYLLMVSRQLGSRIKKSVVLVGVGGIMGVYVSVGEGRVSWWCVVEPFFIVFPCVTLEGFESFSGGGLTFGKFCFLHFMVLVCIAFSSSLLPPVTRISVRTVFPQVRDFLSGSWSSSELLFLFHEKMVLSLRRSHRSFVTLVYVRLCLLCCVPICLVLLWSRLFR